MVGPSSSKEASGAEFATLVDEATPLPVCASEVREAVLGPNHPDTATALLNLGGLYLRQDRLDEAAALFAHGLGTSGLLG